MNSKKLSYYFKEEKLTTFLVIFFGIVFNVSQIFAPMYLGKLIDTIVNGASFESILISSCIYFGVVFSIQVLRFFKRFYVRLFANKTSRRMRHKMYTNTIYQPIDEFDKHTIGDLMSRCVSDVDYTVEGIRKSLTEIFDTGVLMISYFVMLLIYDYKTTLIASIFIPLSIFIAYLLKGRIYKYSSSYRKESSIMNEMTYEMIDHVKDYRFYGSLDNEISDYNTELNNIKKKGIKANLLEGSMEPMYKLIASIGIVFVIYFSGIHVINGDTSLMGLWTIGLFSAYLKLFLSYVKKASKVSKLINTVQKAKISYLRIAPYLVDTTNDNTNDEVLNEDLVVDNLSFGFDDKAIINDLSFSAKKGDIIGVTGSIGSGKSALGISLLGLYPYKGSIKIGESELNQLSQKQRSKLISYMGHNPYLLSDSIKNNILLGDNDDICEVLDDVCLSYDIKSMPNGVDEQIGALGIKMSGGQQSRISLARALHKKNNLIILDDPFAACDIKTEKEIISAIRSKYKDSIIILISHRLTVFPYTDKVLFLDKDNYYFDSHENMLNKSSLYKKIYDIQNEGEKL